MRKKLLRLLWVAPVAMLLFAGSAAAQSTGTIVGVVNDAATGKPVAGALVIATSKALQGEQTAVTDSRGQYTISALPPGAYKLSAQLQGYKPAERGDINLRVDFTLRANLAMVPESVQMDEQVVKTGTAPAVNIGSAEAGTIVSKEYLASVPLASRSYEQAAVIAPTAQRDAYGVSFAGATSPENNYIIDGLRVSDPGFGTLGTNLLTNFVDQLDVKVGSFMPEYGYSSAGIINTVTKSGGNEFHGSIWGNLTPGFFSPSTPAVSTNGQAIVAQSTPYKGSYAADFGLELGGPIIKDKLWFYAGFAPQMNYNVRSKYLQTRVPCPAGSTTCVDASGRPANNPAHGPLIWAGDQYGQFVMSPLGSQTETLATGFNRYFAIAKLTWLINENHNVFASFNTQPGNTYGVFGNNGYNSSSAANVDDNSTNVTLNYTGKFLDKHLLVEARGGWYGSFAKENAVTDNGVNNLLTPAVQWRSTQAVTNFIDLPAGTTCATGACVVSNYITGGGGYVENPKNNRFAGNVSATGLFDLAGQHQLKAGIQLDYSTYDKTAYYSGGAYTRTIGSTTGTSTGGTTGSNSVQLYRGYGVITDGGTNWCTAIDANGNCVNKGYQTANEPGQSVQNTNTWANGYYLQDSWTIANVLTLNFGVRLDTQNVKNNTPGNSSFANSINLNNEWAPRVQAIWDFTGTGRGKIQANWGMYYEAIPLDIAARAFGFEGQVQGYYQLGTCVNKDPKVNPNWNPLTSCPNVFGNAVGEGPGNNNTGNVIALSGPGFTPNSTGFSAVAPDLKGAYTQQFGGGVQYEILQDLTVGVDYLGRRIGNVIEDLSSDDGATYFIANPSVSKPWTVSGGPLDGQTYNPQSAAGWSLGTGTVYTVAWPKPERSYDSVSFTVNKLFSKKWLAQGSYTWSSLRGNYPGLFRPENGQLDPNLTSEYDLVSLLGNKTGPLVGNRTNQIKLAGSYNATLSPDVTLVPSVNFSALSGLPVSATAVHPYYGPGESYILPRGMVGNLDWTIQLDAGAKVLWAISGPYTLQFSLDIFNLLNMQTVQWVDMNYTLLDSMTPMQNAQCNTKTSISSKDPLAALAANCPDLPYARTVDGRRPTVNLNYGRPAAGAGVGAYQSPISARFGVALSF